MSINAGLLLITVHFDGLVSSNARFWLFAQAHASSATGKLQTEDFDIRVFSLCKAIRHHATSPLFKFSPSILQELLSITLWYFKYLMNAWQLPKRVKKAKTSMRLNPIRC